MQPTYLAQHAKTCIFCFWAWGTLQDLPFRNAPAPHPHPHPSVARPSLGGPASLPEEAHPAGWGKKKASPALALFWGAPRAGAERGFRGRETVEWAEDGASRR
jgi:hypothetical protein